MSLLLATIHGAFSAAFSLAATFALILDDMSLAVRMLGVMQAYCIVDMVCIILFPSTQPGPVRLYTVLLHHACVSVGITLCSTSDDARFLMWTALVEYSSLALNVHRLVNRKWSQVCFMVIWILTRVFLLTWLAFRVPHRNAHIFSKLVWSALPFLSWFWTLESLKLAPSFLRQRWSKAPAILPNTSLLLLLPQLMTPMPDWPLWCILALCSFAFHACPTPLTRKLDAAAISMFSVYTLCDVPFLYTLAFVLGYIVKRLREVLWLAVLLSTIREDFLAGKIGISAPIVALAACVYKTRECIDWKQHKCNNLCFVWHSLHTLLICIRLRRI